MNTITVDKNFISLAVSTFLQLQGRLADQESIEIVEWEIDENTDYLILFADTKEEVLN